MLSSGRADTPNGWKISNGKAFEVEVDLNWRKRPVSGRKLTRKWMGGVQRDGYVCIAKYM